MKNCNKTYLTELLGFSNEIQGIDMNFKDKKLEEIYQKSNIINENNKSILFCVLCCLAYIFSMAFSLFVNDFKFVVSMIPHSICMVIEIVLAKVSSNNKDNYKLVNFLKYIRFSIFYFEITILLLFPANFKQDNFLRYIYGTILAMNCLYLYYFDYNIIMIVIVAIFNSLIIITIQYKFSFPAYYFVPEVVMNLVYYFVTSLIKRYELSNRKESFYEHHKNEHYIEYIKQLIDVLNTMVISIKKDDVLFMNNLANNFLKEENIIKEERKETEITNTLIVDQINPKDKLNLFFDSICLISPFESASFELKEGKSLNEIISDIFSDGNINSNYFTRVGYFKTLNNRSKSFEIYVRKLKFKDEVLEILIYDITEIKLAEKISIETKYKQKILGKIAHEFKTPLITITSLVNRMMQNQKDSNIDDPNLRILNHINNLSNYTIVLISDIIQYSSNSIDLRLNKTEVNIRDEMEFCVNVLRTLVDCNENKANKIQTSIEIEEMIDSVSVITDKNRLKQIILNLISNAVKFTLVGFIKIKVKYISEKSSLVISVIDSGMGIKESDNHLIFQENVQLCVNQEYNSKGSGLGLSIVKNLAQSLNHNIWFKSIYGKGSKFSLEMQCTLNPEIQRQNSLQNSISEGFIEEKTNKIINSNNYKSICHLSCENDFSDILNYNETFKKAIIKVNEDFDENDKFQSNLIVETFSINLGVYNTNSNYDIIVIDDQRFIRDSLVNIIKNVIKKLETPNVEIIEGSDGIDLLNHIRLDHSHKIKCIFIDENMQYLNGTDVIKILRKLENNGKIQNYNVVSITAFEDNETKERILNSGANSIISKPCTKSDITKILKKLF